MAHKTIFRDLSIDDLCIFLDEADIPYEVYGEKEYQLIGVQNNLHCLIGIEPNESLLMIVTKFQLDMTKSHLFSDFCERFNSQILVARAALNLDDESILFDHYQVLQEYDIVDSSYVMNWIDTFEGSVLFGVDETDTQNVISASDNDGDT